ncbi:MAG: LPS-assembly protein LptD, partial [Hyphomicrobiaceae bacterium]
ARRAIRRDGNVTTFEQGKFTPCRNDPGKPPLWCIAAQRIIHDKEAATITYQDAQFELYGMPVFYLPYFQHPDPSVKNRSGFLIPEISHDGTRGTMVEVPYHFALAPNYDFLFHPLYMSKQGVLWKGDWRHKVNFGNDVSGVYNVKLAGIEQNNSTDVNEDLRNKWRGSVETHGRFSLASWWSFGWDVIAESDKAFRQFYRLDNVLQKDRVNTGFVAGMSDRNYLGLSVYHVGGIYLNDDLNTLTPGVTAPYVPSQASPSLAPVMDYDYTVGQPVAGGELKVKANAVSYAQDLNFTDGGGVQRSIGQKVNRATASVSWRRKLIDQLGQTFTPFFALRGDVLDVQNGVDPETQLVIDQQSVARGVATAGVNYAYPFIATTSTASHVIEPVGQIIARQGSVNQRNLPNIDARSVMFDDVNLFEEKTSGYDRIDTGVRANYGLQYTFQSFAGGSARVLAGQSYHLSGDNIFNNPGVDSDGNYLMSPESGLQRSASDYVFGLYLSPVSLVRAVAQARLDEETRALRRADAQVTTSWGPVLASAAYAYTSASSLLNAAEDQEEVQGLLGLRLTDRWSVYGMIRYSINQSQTLQDVIQLRYADECYVMTASYVEDRITDPTRNLTPDRTLMFRFELKHLGEFRYRTTALDNVLGANQLTPQ